ncbi:MAG: methyltransferase domain-containing protein [Gammaproteobacteria bacterium]|nr:methyltransferase domain-containing protein [Gammaproteobacteria bacterium]
MDRNFDHLAQRFEQRVYGGLKGEIRLAVIWRDLLPIIEQLESGGGCFEVLDIGAGLAQLATRLAKRGHRVQYNDISAIMQGKAQQRVRDAGVVPQFNWHCGNYFDLPSPGNYQLLQCHALLEWLDQPQRAIEFAALQLAPGGYLSLCFYNPAAKIYRNLIRGNFAWLQQSGSYRSDTGSLTPNHPCELEQVRSWLQQAGFAVCSESGIRVFHDYVVEKRGGHNSPEEVLDMELKYSSQEPFKWLGRYLHIMAKRCG